MAKCPEKVTFGFDPKTKPLLNDRVAFILWACIRAQHIVNQYFDDNIEWAARRIKESTPLPTPASEMLYPNCQPRISWEDFRNIISSCDLRSFGTVCGSGYYFPSMDEEYWRGVYAYVVGDAELQWDVKIKEAKCG